MDSLLQAVGERSGDLEGHCTARRLFGNRWLERWHLLSLDAPTVAAAWTWLVAHAAGVDLPWTELAAMFLAVWVLYAADRLLDARGLEAGDASGLEHRHIFHHQGRVGFRWGMGIACAGLAGLLPGMPSAELQRYVLLGTLLVGWFLVIHTGTKPLPKEFVVGIFFAAAVFVPTIARAPGLRAEMVLPAAIFGAACSLNCVFIYAWESEASASTCVHRGTRVVGRIVVPVTLAFAVTAGVAAMLRGPGCVLFGACAASLLLLLALHGARQHIERTSLRALADVALLTPLLAGFWLR